PRAGPPAYRGGVTPISRPGPARQMTIGIKEDESVRKIQVTIDDETVRLLEALAVPRAGDKSVVVREAVRRMAEQEGFEQYLDWLERRSEEHTSELQSRETLVC